MELARLRGQGIHFELMLGPAYFGAHQTRIAQTRILEAGKMLFEAGKLKIEVSKIFRWSRRRKRTA